MLPFLNPSKLWGKRRVIKEFFFVKETKKLLLFDIDGTLLVSGGAGNRVRANYRLQHQGPVNGGDDFKVGGNLEPNAADSYQYISHPLL